MKKKKPATKGTPQKPALTSQQENFCYEYVKDYNGTQAAIRAKYSPKTARQQASQLLTKLNIKAKINELKEARFNRLKLSADLVVKELLKIATVDIREAYDEKGKLKPLHELSEPLAKAIAGVDFRKSKKIIKTWDKPRALELLGKHLKMFTDVTEHRGLENLAEKLKQARQRSKICSKSSKKKT